MKLFLDQMLRAELGDLLRREGHDVRRAGEVGKGRADDAEILEQACCEDRILITLDEHFGDWVVLPLSRHPGVVRVKVHPASTENIARLLLPFLSGRQADSFRNRLIILSLRNIRWIETAGD
jgi:predicted nuclease of predicted toxin-antitoxin system